MACWRSRLRSWRRGHRHRAPPHAAPTRPTPLGGDPRAERRVGQRSLQGVLGRGVGDDRLGPLPAEGGQGGPDLGHHPAGDDAALDELLGLGRPSAMSSLWPSASRTPSTSVIRTSWRAPRPAAIPAATSSALTLQTIPSSSRASGATTGTWPPTRIASSRSRRSPTTLATSPRCGIALGDRAGRRPRRTARPRRRRGRAGRRRVRC